MYRTYVGHLHPNGGWIDAYTSDGVRRLAQADGGTGAVSDPERPRTAVALAHAVLADLFGAPVAEGLAVTFAADLLGSAPAHDFALEESRIRDWFDGGAVRRMSGNELVEHLGSIALADETEDAAALASVVDRCWSGRTLSN